VSEEVNRKLLAGNTTVQLSTAYIPIVSTTMHSVTDRQTDSQTDGSIMPIADHNA